MGPFLQRLLGLILLLFLAGLDPVLAMDLEDSPAENPSVSEKEEIKLILGSDECRSLIRKKRRAITQLARKKNLVDVTEITPAGKKKLLRILELQEKQLNSLESYLVIGILGLKEGLNKNTETESSLIDDSLFKRIQLASLGVQEEYNHALEFHQEGKIHSESEASSLNSTEDNLIIRETMSQILGKVSESVDQLEENLDDQAFKKAVRVEGANFVTVVTVNDEEIEDHAEEGERQAVKLIDQQNNQFSLSKPRDSTMPSEDPHLIYDGVVILVVGFLLGTLFSLLSLPIFFGHLLTGVILGPSCLNLLTNLVQIETLGQFGVYFILFVLGLEFNFEKLKKNWETSVYGTLILMALTILTLLFLGFFLDTPAAASLLIGACVSLSSTAVVLKCLEPQEKLTTSGQALFGVLVVQDVLLGVILAILPILEKTDSTPLEIIMTLISLLFKTGCFFFVCIVIFKFVSVPFFDFLMGSKSTELFMFGALSLCFLLLKLSDFFELSAEVGAFAAGLIISSEQAFVERTLHSIEPVRDFFSAIFFASIGFHVYPSFLFQQGFSLLVFAFAAVGFKFLTSYAVFSRGFGLEKLDAVTVAIGLAQISEFSFVIASRGKRHGIITREIYFLLLGTATLSLLVTPILFKVSGVSSLPPRGLHRKNSSNSLFESTFDGA